MKYRRTLWALAALNAALLLALVWKLGGENAAHAQPMRSRGELVMVPADNPIMNNGVIYMLDVQNGVLGGFAFDHNTKSLAVMQPIDLNRLFLAATGSR